MDRDCDAPRNGGSKDEQRPLTRDNKFCNSSFLDSGKLFRILAQVIALNSAEFTRVLPGPGLYPSRRNSGHRAMSHSTHLSSCAGMRWSVPELGPNLGTNSPQRKLGDGQLFEMNGGLGRD